MESWEEKWKTFVLNEDVDKKELWEKLPKFVYRVEIWGFDGKGWPITPNSSRPDGISKRRYEFEKHGLGWRGNSSGWNTSILDPDDPLGSEGFWFACNPSLCLASVSGYDSEGVDYFDDFGKGENRGQQVLLTIPKAALDPEKIIIDPDMDDEESMKKKGLENTSLFYKGIVPASKIKVSRLKDSKDSLDFEKYK